MTRAGSAAGFSLIEVLIATVLVCSAIAGLAHLGAIGVTQAADVQRGALALALAQSKLEELRASPWAFDATGARVSAPALLVSPADSLTEDASGFVDSFDRFGEPASPAAPAIYRRRWAISPFDPVDPDTLLLQICVVPGGSPDLPADACVATIRTRHP